MIADKSRLISSIVFFLVITQLFKEPIFNIRVDLLGLSLGCIFIISVVYEKILQREFWQISKYFLPFLIVSLLVNLGWSIKDQDISYLSHSILHLSIFLFISLIINLVINYKETFIKSLFWSILSASIILIFSFLFFSRGEYDDLFFNNRNQLGRTALTMASISSFLFFGYKETINSKHLKYILITILSVCIMLSWYSLSRSVIVGSVLLVLILVFFDIKIAFASAILALFLLAGTYTLNQAGVQRIKDNLHYRFIKEKGADDKLLGRGYSRLIEYPKYLFIGAGEHKQSRFNDEFEFHSSFGNILFAYGIAGLLALMWFLYKTVFPVRKLHLFLLPIFFYGLFHNDIRNVFFWILICLIILSKDLVLQYGKSIRNPELLNNIL